MVQTSPTLFSRKVKSIRPVLDLDERSIIEQAWEDDTPELPNWLVAATSHPKALWRRYERHCTLFPMSPSQSGLMLQMVVIAVVAALAASFAAGMLTRFTNGLMPLIFLALGGGIGGGIGWLRACATAYRHCYMPLYVSENSSFGRALETTDQLDMKAPLIRWYDRQHDALNIESQVSTVEDAYGHLQMPYGVHIWDLRAEEELRGLPAAESDTLEGPLNDAYVQMEIHEEDGLLGNDTRRQKDWADRLIKNFGFIAFAIMVAGGFLQLIMMSDGTLLGRSDIDYRRTQISEMREDVRRQHQTAMESAGLAPAAETETGQAAE